MTLISKGVVGTPPHLKNPNESLIKQIHKVAMGGSIPDLAQIHVLPIGNPALLSQILQCHLLALMHTIMQFLSFRINQGININLRNSQNNSSLLKLCQSLNDE